MLACSSPAIPPRTAIVSEDVLPSRLANQPADREASFDTGTMLHAVEHPLTGNTPARPIFTCSDGRQLPLYTEFAAHLPDGLYLGLFNGRNDPYVSAADAGFDGPLIGRLRYSHTVEAREIRLEFVAPFEGRIFFPDMEVTAGASGHVPTGKVSLPILLGLSSGAIVFDSRYFADWTTFIISSARPVIGRDLTSQRRV